MLLRYSQPFAAESDHTFYLIYFAECGFAKANNIAMQKVIGVLNAGTFESVNFGETVKDFVASDKPFKELQLVREGVIQRFYQW